MREGPLEKRWKQIIQLGHQGVTFLSKENANQWHHWQFQTYISDLPRQEITSKLYPKLNQSNESKVHNFIYQDINLQSKYKNLIFIEMQILLLSILDNYTFLTGAGYFLEDTG